jgi:dinuclear metal center YbgI/SA1388 family protein
VKTDELEKVFVSFFKKEILLFFKDQTQYGFNNKRDLDIKKIGISVDLTLDVIEKAKNNHVDLILTHHNIWDDYYEWHDLCLEKLVEYQIVHYFNHLVLDNAPFGPTGSLVKGLGLKQLYPFCKLSDFYFGIIGEFKEAISLNEIQVRLTKYCGHEIRVWQNNNRLIKRVGVVSGSGADIETLREAYLNQCDAYITGEKKSKSLLYAKQVGMNFILGSHTFTEYNGLKAYANLIKENAKDIEIISLQENHFE